MTRPVHLAGWARTPVGRPMGQLARADAVVLGAEAVRAACDRAGADPAGVPAVWGACQLAAGLGPNPALRAARAAGCRPGTTCRTLVAGRAAGLQAVVQAFFEAGVYGTVAAVGFDSVSGSPLLLPKGRAGSRLGSTPLWDPAVHDAAIDAPGAADPDLAERSRAACVAHAGGPWVAPVILEGRTGPRRRVDADELPEADADAACAPLADGGAAVVLRGDGGTGPRVVAGVPGGEGGGPVAVAQGLLTMTGWRADQVTVWEIPEDAARVARATIDALGVPRDRVNVHGGALGRGVPPAAGGVLALVHACAALAAAGGGRALVLAGSGPADAAGVALELL